MVKNKLSEAFRMELNTSNRIFGLDFLRFVAIMMVLLGHANMLLPKFASDFIKYYLLDGVAIFFVLSGFLIGGILIRQLEKGKDGWGDLLYFWKRRWMRTLPAYFLVLTVILVYTLIVDPSLLPDHAWKFYLFVQNLFEPRPGLFGEAWSLSIEEWFYLLIPLFIFTGIAVFRSSPKRIVLAVIVIVIAAVLLYRYWIYQSIMSDTTIKTFKELHFRGDELITYRVIPRLDALMFGVFGAYLMQYFPKIWAASNSYFRVWLFFLGIVLLYACKRNNATDFEVYDGVFAHATRSISVLLTLPFLSTLVVRPNWLTRFITFISLISYSMYLLNLKIVLLMIMKNGIYHQMTGKFHVHAHWQLDYGIFWVILVLLSYLMYQFIELPFMKLRK